MGRYKKYLVFLLSFSIYFLPFHVFPATAPSGGGGGWTNKTVTRVALSDVIEATARQQAVRNGTAVTLEAVVQETINRQAVGKVILKRLLAGGLLISATQSLLDGIGWVMEDGVYVKYKYPDQDKPDPTKPRIYEYICLDKKYHNTLSQLETCALADMQKRFPEYFDRAKATMNSPLEGEVKIFYKKSDSYTTYYFNYVENPFYNPSAPEQKPERVVLTDQLAGDLAVGDYTDPVDQSKNKKDKVWTDVENSYKPDVVGNDLSDKVDNKLDNAPETNNKPSTPPKPDADGQKYPAPDEKPGGQGETENKPNPETGTQTGTFTLPDWCLWAADQCQWHKEEKEVWKEEKKQRDDQKSFFADVKTFFVDISKKIDDIFKEKDNSDTELDIDSEDDNQPDTTISFSTACPAKIPLTFNWNGQTLDFSFDFTIWCEAVSTFVYPIVVALGSLHALYIVAGVRQDV
ncbi:virulence factor TspB C-terminal domain-related protein [Acinetobacter bereziniae]|uniref:virulence factor TspB C-terminal domain-related protein n=1 Tax=Acinetobacter bereziniae TaxID=106648 RepID=UPI0019018CD3|nr:virulence factor TspB C-terminal domain-related protein [Acinetobacter bereziniae]MBJ9905341.1 hypothetical protein [Acinetobacter bereziniae]MCU4321843.1 hypothetical protein [Acinetobacter bereziniae]MCU4601463.1 hypothetical protein [Acinetobacter bereziniae]